MHRNVNFWRFCKGQTLFPKILHTLLRNYYQPAGPFRSKKCWEDFGLGRYRFRTISVWEDFSLGGYSGTWEWDDISDRRNSNSRSMTWEDLGFGIFLFGRIFREGPVVPLLPQSQNKEQCHYSNVSSFRKFKFILSINSISTQNWSKSAQKEQGTTPQSRNQKRHQKRTSNGDCDVVVESISKFSKQSSKVKTEYEILWIIAIVSICVIIEGDTRISSKLDSRTPSLKVLALWVLIVEMFILVSYHPNGPAPYFRRSEYRISPNMLCPTNGLLFEWFLDGVKSLIRTL